MRVSLSILGCRYLYQSELCEGPKTKEDSARKKRLATSAGNLVQADPASNPRSGQIEVCKVELRFTQAKGSELSEDSIEIPPHG